MQFDIYIPDRKANESKSKIIKRSLNTEDNNEIRDRKATAYDNKKLYLLLAAGCAQ